MAAKWAYYYPEWDGYVHIRTLREDTTQGTAVLVRSVKDGKLYVRKKTWNSLSEDESELCGDIEFWRPHPNAPKLLLSKSYIVRTPGFPPDRHSILIFEYANCGDLEKVYERSISALGKVPEVLILRCLSQMLTLIHFMHFDCNPPFHHNDLSFTNIVAQITDGKQLPDFLAADFGVAKFLDADNEEYRLEQIENEFADLRQAVSYLINGIDLPAHREDIADNYSADLLEVYNALRDLPKYGFNLDNYEARLRNLRALAEYFAQESQKVCDIDFSFLRSPDDSGEEALFDSYEDLVSSEKVLPGPWQGMEINPATREILKIDPRRHEENRVLVWNKNRVLINPVNP